MSPSRRFSLIQAWFRITGIVTGQVGVHQVSQAEQRRVQQTLTADWRKSRKLQEQKQSLRLFMHPLVRRDILQTKNMFWSDRYHWPFKYTVHYRLLISIDQYWELMDFWPRLWRWERLSPQASSHQEDPRKRSHTGRDPRSPTWRQTHQLTVPGLSRTSPGELSLAQSTRSNPDVCVTWAGRWASAPRRSRSERGGSEPKSSSCSSDRVSAAAGPTGSQQHPQNQNTATTHWSSLWR